MLIPTLRSYIHEVIDFLMPSRCIDCGDIIASPNSMCIKCWPRYSFIEDPCCNICGRMLDVDVHGSKSIVCGLCIQSRPDYDLARSLLKFDDVSKSIIHNFKYRDKTYVSKFFAQLLSNRYAHLINSANIVTCVPMHKYKRIFRLYNQSQLLAADIASIAGKKFRPDLIAKLYNTKSQSSLTKSQRKSNLSSSFEVLENLKEMTILLVDDVITTEATINTCAKALKKAGAQKVYCITIAKNYF